MKAIVRNVLLACLISTFALFGALGRPQPKHGNTVIVAANSTAPFITESAKESLTCLGIAFLAWALCIWRCTVLNRRINAERQYQARFNEYMRSSAFNRRF